MVNKKTINFVLASNDAGSLTRLISVYADRLTADGIDVIISYPVVNFWDFHKWRLNREYDKKAKSLLKAFMYYIELVKPVLDALLKVATFRMPLSWYGKMHNIDSKIRLNRYFLSPTDRNMPKADLIMVMGQEYIIPHLLRLRNGKGKIVSSIHLDYVAAMSDAKFGDWWRHLMYIGRQTNIPRFAVSECVRESAKHLGINIQETVVYSNVDLSEFEDGRRRGSVEPVNIALYCDARPQKGTEFGYKVIERVRKELACDDVTYNRFGSTPILPGGDEAVSGLFDSNFGYLLGKDLIKLLQGTDIFIFPSLYEGFPLMLLQAMACGCAVVTTAFAGADEVCEHMNNCMMSEPKDTVKMADNVRELVKNIVLRDSMRENSLLTVKKFSSEIMGSKFLDFVKENMK